MDAVVDTVALVHHLNDSLPAAAEKVFRQAEGGNGRLWLPEVALGEFAYLALKGRIRIPNPRALVEEVLNVVRGAGYLRTGVAGVVNVSRLTDS